MKKTIMFLMLAIFAIPFITAYTDGQIVTQAQINSIDFNSYASAQSMITLMDCRVDVDGKKIYDNGEWYYYKQFHCFNLIELEEGIYQVYTDFYYPHFKVNDFRLCMAMNTAEYCSSQFTHNLNAQAKSSINILRARLQGLQTDDSDYDIAGIGSLW